MGESPRSHRSGQRNYSPFRKDASIGCHSLVMACVSSLSLVDRFQEMMYSAFARPTINVTSNYTIPSRVRYTGTELVFIDIDGKYKEEEKGVKINLQRREQRDRAYRNKVSRQLRQDKNALALRE
ncbi:hypothetical protein PRIPAC_95799 [Pristionchus pacificus]|uniref:Uncharacterized protein n=1 Tax=Pristionchus pacificus TaxID=54126 RepID=A0A2A6CH70_PRIPA|nr:hypothetical protein PRIPAC_95799 [Pristionchus pacificus]|eukprot:PDM77371.1 hypothetical protein PRIPAC_33101 [Pristionchus pacificus]